MNPRVNLMPLDVTLPKKSCHYLPSIKCKSHEDPELDQQQRHLMQVVKKLCVVKDLKWKHGNREKHLSVLAGRRTRSPSFEYNAP